MSLQKGLDTLTNVAVIATGIVACSWMALQIRQPSTRSAGGSAIAPTTQSEARNAAGAISYRLGDKAPLPDEIKYADAKQTLVLFVRNTCRFCSASMPFYKRIAESQSRSAHRLRLVAASTDSTDDTAEYLGKHHLSVDQIVSFDYDPNVVKVAVTPTLVLVDSNGVVQNLWRGEQRPTGEQKIFAALGETLSVPPSTNTRSAGATPTVSSPF